MTNLKKIISTIVIGAFAIIGVYGTIVLISTSLDKSEVVECLKLESQAKNFAGFYLTEWQNEMCEAHDIFIDAPVGAPDYNSADWLEE